MTAPHGTLARYTGETRCRCDDCRRASTEYRRRHRKEVKLYGPRLVPAAGLQARVRALQAIGWSVREISEAGRISFNQLEGAMRREVVNRSLDTAVNRAYEALHKRIGPHQINRTTAQKRGWAPPDKYTGHFPAPSLGVVRRVRALNAIGWSAPVIAREAGVSMDQLDEARQNETVSRFLHWRVATAYDRLSMTKGPSSHAEVYARAQGWAPPLAYEDIDDPDENPDVYITNRRVRERALRNRRRASVRSANEPKEKPCLSA